MMQVSKRIAAAVLLSTGCAWSAVAQEPAPAASCKVVHADMVELRSTVGCKPEHATCFLGEVVGNHGLLGTTYFKSDAGAAGPSTSPGFISYSGVFEYITPQGTIVTRETGVVNQTQGQADSGAVTAYQAITERHRRARGDDRPLLRQRLQPGRSGRDQSHGAGVQGVIFPRLCGCPVVRWPERALDCRATDNHAIP